MTTEKILQRAANRLLKKAAIHRSKSRTARGRRQANLKAAICADRAVKAIQVAIHWAADADSYSTTGLPSQKEEKL